MKKKVFKLIKDFRSNDFLSLEKLEAIKKESAVSVSLIIPALNEASTIGKIVAFVREKLSKQHSIVDEIIVMDGTSEDATVVTAERAGAKVFNVNTIGPEAPCTGKGVGLWKSQFISQGDILIFIDADIIDFDERFVCGLLGPLLSDQEIYFTKAYYRRPLVLGTEYYENFGGRVTEILMRPLLNTFIPELTFVKQPLSGEYAVRRNVLNELPFWSGYGVETGFLLEMFFRFGLSHIAQVDMENRCHRNRNVKELGMMSNCILQVFFTVLERYGYISLNHNAYKLFQAQNDFNKFENHDVELPSRKSMEYKLSKE
jgi:glucosyl-3-phosphoglycerate synthase